MEPKNERGLDSRMVTADEAHTLCPMLAGDDILAAAFSPGDGHAAPEDVVQGYAVGTRNHGGHIEVGCEVLAINTTGGTIDFESSFYFHREGPGLLMECPIQTRSPASASRPPTIGSST